ncbi:MAG: hypothetical protein DMF84_10345 [Acidobacteria bacterium]|nr:MAG: hypothetical protein DMF84_10345 [Acidobacteriota bacterium]
MSDLAARTLSQGLQAFIPVAIWMTWAARHYGSRERLWTRLALVASLPACLLATQVFRTSTHQSQWEAALAATALVPALWFVAEVTGARCATPPRAFLFGAVVLLIVRQAMEVGAALVAVIDARSFQALLSIGTGAAIALAAALVSAACIRRLPARPFRAAMVTFAALFIAQIALYMLHESAEARWLPSSEALHTATEPYGPEGVYGRYISDLLVILPLSAALASAIAARVTSMFPSSEAARVFRPHAALLLVLISMPVLAEVSVRSVTSRTAMAAAPAVLTAALQTPHVLFRHTAIDAAYGAISVASLDRPDGSRVSAALTCERVAYAAGQGICLRADRGVFTTYTAVLLDRDLQPRGTIPLDGSISRTRISPDGRVGAITVFVAGDGYTNMSRSTRTTLIDMAAGEVLGDLEQFTTWREGARFKATDFNFWGVTFTRDSNVFYASLQTGGRTFLVRGDLGLRKLVVVRENVECPSLSPANDVLAFKKRVEGTPIRWRFALLDLSTGREWLLDAETRSIDDQIEWLDATHVLYGVPRSGSGVTDVWVAPIDGGGPARVFIPAAESPAVVH